ncbi:MAG: hypothetical protein ACK2T2_14345 [Anaerolineales bacterium]|jgi:hypothetical protein
MWKGIVLLLLIMFGAMWVIVRPAILIAQPSPAFPEGTTLIYLDKPADMRVFESTDRQCVDIYASTSDSCRDQMLVEDRILFQSELVQLPYMPWLADLLGVSP